MIHRMTVLRRTVVRSVLASLAVGCLLAVTPASAQYPATSSGQSAPAPASSVLHVDAGPCMADFVVRDASGKGIYDAKITMQLKYGFMGVRKIDLNVGTNADGKASIDGLPNKIRGTAQFKIAQGSRESFVEYDPAVHCYAMHNVTLSESTPSQTK